MGDQICEIMDERLELVFCIEISENKRGDISKQREVRNKRRRGLKPDNVAGIRPENDDKGVSKMILEVTKKKVVEVMDARNSTLFVFWSMRLEKSGIVRW